MKKSHVIIAVILIALSTSSVFAQTSDYYGEVSPRYSYIMDITTVLVIDNEGKYLLRQLMNNLEQEDLLISLSQVKYAASDTTELEVKKK